MTRFRKAIVVAAAMGLLAGCGGGGGGGDAAEGSAPAGLGEVTVAADGVQEVTVQTQDDFTFTPDRFTVAPGRVRLTVVNAAAQMTHNLHFDDGKGPEPIAAAVDFLGPGQQETIDFEVSVPGEHPFTCTFHTVQGQVGTMTVSQEG
jgi:plastocyanin